MLNYLHFYNELKLNMFKSLPESWGLLLLRLFTLGLRFVFVALFFRYSEALYGEFGLVATTVMLGVYLLGLDFYVYANREMLRGDRKKSHIFFNQILLHLVLYIFLLPVFYVFFQTGFLNKKYLIWFYLVLVAEHLSFEINRLLFVLKKPWAANLNLFFRNGFWTVPLIIFFWKGKDFDLNKVLIWWLAGDILSFLPVLTVVKPKVGETFSTFRPDLKWVKKGLYVSVPFFFATLSFKAIEFSDRYFLDYFYDKTVVGIYTFFSNMSLLVNTVVYTAVISLMFPGIVENLLSDDLKGFSEKFKTFKKKTILWTLSASVLILIFLPFVLAVLNKKEHLHYYHVFVTLVLANILFNLSFVYHFVLYGKKKDAILVVSAFLGMLLNVLMNFILIPLAGMFGAAIGTLFSFGVIYMIKYHFAKKQL